MNSLCNVTYVCIACIFFICIGRCCQSCTFNSCSCPIMPPSSTASDPLRKARLCTLILVNDVTVASSQSSMQASQRGSTQWLFHSLQKTTKQNHVEPPWCFFFFFFFFFFFCVCVSVCDNHTPLLCPPCTTAVSNRWPAVCCVLRFLESCPSQKRSRGQCWEIRCHRPLSGRPGK